MKNRFAHPTPGGWADCCVNFRLQSPFGGCGASWQHHVAELQFIEERLLSQRKGLGGHAYYTAFRTAAEYVERGVAVWGRPPELYDREASLLGEKNGEKSSEKARLLKMAAALRAIAWGPAPPTQGASGGSSTGADDKGSFCCNLSGLGLQDEDAKALASALRDYPRSGYPRKLDLSANAIGEAGAVALAVALRHNSEVLSVDLFGNPLSSRIRARLDAIAAGESVVRSDHGPTAVGDRRWPDEESGPTTSANADKAEEAGKAAPTIVPKTPSTATATQAKGKTRTPANSAGDTAGPRSAFVGRRLVKKASLLLGSGFVKNSTASSQKTGVPPPPSSSLSSTTTSTTQLFRPRFLGNPPEALLAGAPADLQLFLTQLREPATVLDPRFTQAMSSTTTPGPQSREGGGARGSGKPQRNTEPRGAAAAKAARHRKEQQQEPELELLFGQKSFMSIGCMIYAVTK